MCLLSVCPSSQWAKLTENDALFISSFQDCAYIHECRRKMQGTTTSTWDEGCVVDFDISSQIFYVPSVCDLSTKYMGPILTANKANMST